METTFKISVQIRTLKGMKEIGSFQMGSSADLAKNTFNSLKGDPLLANTAYLRMDLVKEGEWYLPVCISSIGCTLDEYTENCRIITRDAYKYFTLEQPINDSPEP